MLRSRRRLLWLFATLPALLVISALIYMAGMSWLEGEERSFWYSLGFAAETLSTTGYGIDGRWDHPAMVLFVIALQFLGVFLIFLVFPIYLIPFLEERFETRLPTEVDDLSNHVVIFRSGSAVESLFDELASANVETLVIEEDDAAARRLVEQGRNVLFGSLDDDILERAHLLEARALIANSSDDEDAAVVLTARQMGFEGDILALVEEPFHRKPILLAGATAVYTPKHALGAALAARASRRVAPAVSGSQTLGDRLRVSELRIVGDSELAGRTLEEADLGRRTGVTVIGQWTRGRLEAPVRSDSEIEPDSILVIVGSDEAIERLGELGRGASMLPVEGPFVIAGFGEVGSKVHELLADADEELIVIDQEEREGVDVVGDVLDPRVGEEAGITEAQAVILALDTDSATLFATVILKDLAPDVPIIARVNRAENIERIRRAGAEFSQSVSQVSGQILARRLLGESSFSVDPQLKVVQVDAGPLVGKHPATMDIRERTGCSVVAVQRGDDLVCEFGEDFRVREGDHVYLCGSNESTRRFREVFGD